MRTFLHPFAFFDSPTVLDCTVTPIPGSGSSPLEVVSSLPIRINGVHTIESTGQYIGVYSGPIGAEVLRCVVGGGAPSLVEVGIASGERVSIRSMDTTAITAGSVVCQFMGKS